MNNHEDVFVKISMDFHNQINPLLRKINPEVTSADCIRRQNIYGKMELLKLKLLSVNEKKVSKPAMIELKRILQIYYEKIKGFFEIGELATGFLYFLPHQTEMENYFYQMEEFVNIEHQTFRGIHRFFVGLSAIAFPSDCSVKLYASIDKGEIKIKRRDEALYLPEKREGDLIYFASGSREEQKIHDAKFRENNKGIVKSEIASITTEFRSFCEKTRQQNNYLINEFLNSIKLIDRYLYKSYGDEYLQGYVIDIVFIEMIYEFLVTNGYIKVKFKEFKAIFKDKVPATRIIWLQSGARLKYFINKLDDICHLSGGKNNWAEQRFQLRGINDLAIYLRKQSSKAEYINLDNGNYPQDGLYKLMNSLKNMILDKSNNIKVDSFIS